MKAATKAAVLCAAIAAAFSAQAELKDFTVNGETVTKAQQEEQARDVMAARRTDKMTPEIEAEVKRRLTRITAVAQAAKTMVPCLSSCRLKTLSLSLPTN